MGVHERPERLAAAWALGIAVGLSPVIGLHTVIALLLALAFRLNKVDVILGTLIINPWTVTLYFPAAILVGEKITGVHVPHFLIPHPEEVLHAAMWRQRAPWLRSVLVTWGVGAAVLAMIGGAITYFALSRLIVLHRRRHPHHLDTPVE
ncbi:MAG: DUF2062 domain-containing protein [Acidobacteriia bacterium]|nr:DUF2062 domain-containing protein [Terriglobia bacterium]